VGQWVFCRASNQGVKFRSGADPVLYLSNPEGYSPTARRRFLDDLWSLNKLNYEEYQDPEISARIAQYEMAFRMQSSVPELADLSKESPETFELYGPDSRKPGSYAANCILARRLAERGVRFIQLFHRGWDQHGNLPREIRGHCMQTDQPSAALIQDLKQRGMLDENAGSVVRRVRPYGLFARHVDGNQLWARSPSAVLSIWMAGGGIKGGLTYGETD